jgi:hypothetical protein
MLLATSWEFELFDADAQVVYTGLFVLAGCAVILRRTHYDQEGGH